MQTTPRSLGANHSQESWCGFSWGVVHETRDVISLLVLPGWCTVLGQRSSNLDVSPSPSAKEQLRGAGVWWEVLSFGLLFSRQ